MAVGDLASLRLHLNQFPGHFEVAWGFQSTSGVANWRQIVMDGFAVLAGPTLMLALSQDVGFRNITMVDVVPGTAPDIQSSSGLLLDGAINQRRLPPQVAARINWTTGLAGRSYRGASFIPGLPRTALANDANSWQAADMARLQAFVDVMMLQYGPTGTSTFARLVIISRQLDGVVRAVPVGTQVQAGAVVSAIRSRRDRQGA